LTKIVSSILPSLLPERQAKYMELKTGTFSPDKIMDLYFERSPELLFKDNPTLSTVCSTAYQPLPDSMLDVKVKAIYLMHHPI